jgi:ribosome-binding factor A
MTRRLLPVSIIKKNQKEALLFREIATLFQATTWENKALTGFFVNRVELSPDKGHCTIYVYTAGGEAAYLKQLDLLKAYKPSLRKALSQKIKGRYTPNLVFKFDDKFERVQAIEELLEKVKQEDTPSKPAFDESEE